MYKFISKSKTLMYLEDKLLKSHILSQVSYNQDELNCKYHDIVKRLNYEFGDELVIVRSSAVDEDTIEQSNAGKYSSFLNVKGVRKILEYSNEIFNEYKINSSDSYVFVQKMITNIKMSGVLFTANPNNGTLQYIINFDDTTNYTDSVTSGTSNNTRLYYHYSEAEPTSKEMFKIIEASKEIQSLLASDYLDIEFAIDSNDVIYIFQVRPLYCSKKILTEREQKLLMRKMKTKINHYFNKQSHLYGKDTILGVMPDWNPAEIIGLRPKALALSLYQNLITDFVWAESRSQYGYLNVTSNKLLIDMHGIPYIDCRASFNSLMPSNLQSNIYNKLIDFYLCKLRNNKHYHDKVEFDILITSFTFDLDDKLSELINVLNESEINEFKVSLIRLTQNLIKKKDSPFLDDINKIEKLKSLQETYDFSSKSQIEALSILLDDCKEYGTKAFSGLARAGFIAIQLLRSLVKMEIMSENDYYSFLSTIETCSTEMITDLYNNINLINFNKKYGHLRPGTYDITSFRYDYDTEKYYNNFMNQSMNKPHKEFKFSDYQIKKIEKLLIHYKINVDFYDLVSFIKNAIKYRELSKFCFTKNLSDAIEIVAEIGQYFSLDRDDMSYVNINTLLKYPELNNTLLQELNKNIRSEKKMYNESLALTLPALICNPNEIYSFEMIQDSPNYITLDSIIGKVSTHSDNHENLNGSIVFIEAADPGYDWIFTKGIRGIVTAYGGANSHMAIRSSELSIPAVIGIGLDSYNALKKNKFIEIDCAKKIIRGRRVGFEVGISNSTV